MVLNGAFWECKTQREAKAEVFSFSVFIWSNHKTGQFCGCSFSGRTRNDCTNHREFLWDKIALTVPLQQIKRLLSFYNKDFYRITSLPSHFSLPSFQNQRKINLGFKNTALCHGKISQFWFKHLFWRFKIMLTGFFMANKISHTIQLQAVVFLWCFVLWRAGTVQTVPAYIWALNTDHKLHHKEQLISQESTDHSFLTAWWEKKKYWIPNVIFLNWKLPKMLLILFFDLFLAL